jgi:hypothetical protein
MFRLVRTSLVSQLLWRPLKWEPTWKKWLWCIYVPLNLNILKFTIDLVPPRHRFMSMKAGSDLRPVSQPMTSEYFPQILAADLVGIYFFVGSGRKMNQGTKGHTNQPTYGRQNGLPLQVGCVTRNICPEPSIYAILNLKRWVTAETRFAA